MRNLSFILLINKQNGLVMRKVFVFQILFYLFFIFFYVSYVDGNFYSPGSDLFVYFRLYNDLKGGVSDYYLSYEPGYIFFIYILSAFVNFDWYLKFHNLLFYLSLIYAVLRHSGYKISFILPFYLCFIFFDPFLNGYSEFILRQGAGFIILFIFGFYEMDNRKSYLSSISASFFHFSFLIILFVYFISKYIKSFNSILILVFFSSFLYYFNFGILFSAQLLNFDLKSLTRATEFYELGFKPLFFVATFWIFMLLLLPKYRLIVQNDKKLFRLWSFYTLGVFLLTAFFSGLPYHDRVFSMFWAVQFFIIYNLICRLKLGRRLCI